MAVREVAQQTVENGQGGVLGRGDAEDVLQLVGGVGLAQGGSEALVEAGLEALDGADDGDVRHVVVVGGAEAGCWARALRVVAEQLGDANAADDPDYDEPDQAHQADVEAHHGDMVSVGVVRRRATHALCCAVSGDERAWV